METFFSTSKTVNVSRMTRDGWWIENTVEHVVKGTALGSDFTQNIYTPSTPSMIARYDRELDAWSDEIEDMTWKEYYNENGQRFVVGSPNGQYPESAILLAPPEYDADIQTVLYQNEQWVIYDILIGQKFYDEYGQQFIVSDYNFELPDKHTWEEPLQAEDGYAVKLINGQWQSFIDHRNKVAYAKDRDEDENYLIEELGELPETHTLIEPELYDSWLDGIWQYDVKRHYPFKASEERQWRNSELANVLDRIDQYEKDQAYPVELRTSPIKAEADYLRLLQDRKALSDYPESIDFPFGERPMLFTLK
ncbi:MULTISPECIES: hypothetical protein [unclassified Vibrio]|uniref:hypothetical protein n=1 Tax=unclassified Vibrio TaxID=2614977 RepID=UPI000B8E5EDC|nr:MULTISPECIES: hypothetical protein [unclassified Vibrio]NAW98960.1 hypothetical protein [Vibrio sp. V23_P3S9T160]OXX25731.1 hypothetical protein B9J88_03330 [Vibrio sp. V05_P4A8T149]OXX29976.1 hypothetical protein B9J81_17245 [Vibrio sp. V04_P4A5T148]OXX32395.1 hypothetical protein B9J95_07000 [Vibrio sp. V14_P6S14T42]OXX41191.1 hypothetical protein B9J85_14715 [Vibrio sp. V11_P1A41T118]